jgi:hypothetical protein
MFCFSCEGVFTNRESSDETATFSRGYDPEFVLQMRLETRDHLSNSGSSFSFNSFERNIIKTKEVFEIWRMASDRAPTIKPWKSPFDSDISHSNAEDAELQSNSSIIFDDGFFSSRAMQALHARIRGQKEISTPYPKTDFSLVGLQPHHASESSDDGSGTPYSSPSSQSSLCMTSSLKVAPHQLPRCNLRLPLTAPPIPVRGPRRPAQRRRRLRHA